VIRRKQFISFIENAEVPREWIVPVDRIISIVELDDGLSAVSVQMDDDSYMRIESKTNIANFWMRLNAD
jgi:hypothetical protein